MENELEIELINQTLELMEEDQLFTQENDLKIIYELKFNKIITDEENLLEDLVETI